MTWWILALGVTLLGVGGVVFFNRLVRRRNAVAEGWSGVEVQLKRRHDLIPALVEAAKGFRDHERDTLREVVEKRRGNLAEGGVQEVAREEEVLGRRLGKFLAVVEDYPELSADAHFAQLMEELVEAEDEIQYARRYYNGAVRDLNNACETFPSSLVARLGGFEQAVFFEVDKVQHRQAPKLQLEEEV